MAGFSSLLLLGGLELAMGYLLHLRLRAQFRGENLSEAGARRGLEKVQGQSMGWDLPGFSQAVSAVFEKEVRYLARSGPMLLTLVMPIFVLVIFRLRPLSSALSLSPAPRMAFPRAA